MFENITLHQKCFADDCWLHKVGYFCFKSRGWVLFCFVLFYGGFFSSLVSKYIRMGSSPLELDSMTQEPGNTGTLIPPWISCHKRFWGSLFRRAIRWLYLENNTTEFCQLLDSTNASGDLRFTSCGPSHLFEPFLSRGRSCSFYTGIQKWVTRLL